MREEELKDELFLIEGRDYFWEQHALENFLGRRTKETEKSNCNQGYPGMFFFVTLGIFTHVRFSNVIVSEYLLYC